ncbi:hypothetical protein VSS16_33560 [Streptomyces broussonetiae]|uniref:Transglycosylase SLT domain-containing protein n=1 Tax=Streptomyces broussonetiae TaxID=2686304 RepID=A0ABV5EL67_9ACTN
MSDVAVSSEAVEEARPAELSAEVLDEQLIGPLVDRARASGLQPTGEGGLLQLTKRVLESRRWPAGPSRTGMPWGVQAFGASLLSDPPAGDLRSAHDRQQPRARVSPVEAVDGPVRAQRGSCTRSSASAGWEVCVIAARSSTSTSGSTWAANA